MDILEIIRNRRSIRQYKEDMPDEESIARILEAGRWAPSGLNNQPWKFLIIKDKAQKERLAGFTKYGGIIKNAPVVILIFIDKGESYNWDKDMMAIGAFIQNLLLEAHSLGLGTCWLGEILNKKDEVAHYLKLSKDSELSAVVTLGYPDEKKLGGCRKPLKSLEMRH
ncbi:MAG: nitroreductase [bacterium]